MKEFELYKGQLVKILDQDVKCVPLPDWSLCFVEMPPSEERKAWLEKVRPILRQRGQRIVNVKAARVYFEPVYVEPMED